MRLYSVFPQTKWMVVVTCIRCEKSNLSLFCLTFAFAACGQIINLAQCFCGNIETASHWSISVIDPESRFCSRCTRFSTALTRCFFISVNILPLTVIRFVYPKINATANQSQKVLVSGAAFAVIPKFGSPEAASFAKKLPKYATSFSHIASKACSPIKLRNSWPLRDSK